MMKNMYSVALQSISYNRQQMCFCYVYIYTIYLPDLLVCSSFLFSSFGFCQTIVRQSSEPYDLVRTLRMAGYGMLILGPSLHFWFNFVSRVLPKRDLITTLKKIVLGQTVYGPTMTVVFFSANAALQGIMYFQFHVHFIAFYCSLY